MNVLLLNAGSSSLKATLMASADGTVAARALADWAGSKTRYQYTGPDGRDRSEEVSWTGHAKAVQRFIVDLLQTEPIALVNRSALTAVGHRVVHGGQFTSSVRITPEVRSRITGLADLAPLHNPPSLETLAAAEMELPSVPHVAVFDTAFHATLPPEARTYPVPLSWTRDWGIRRFGFHGLSHAYCSRRAAELEAGRAGHQGSQLALAIYTHRVRQAIGALTVTLGGVDALVFTAGVGEHASEIRRRICEGLECLGLELDTEANAACRPDAIVSRASSRGRILIVATREDVTMLREVIQVIGKDANHKNQGHS